VADEIQCQVIRRYSVFKLISSLCGGCIAIASADSVITINEAEYLRAIADALGCPIPPMISPQ
jgi:hypothetical protein